MNIETLFTTKESIFMRPRSTRHRIRGINLVGNGTIYDVPESIQTGLNGDVTAAFNTFFGTVPNGTPDNPSIIQFPIAQVYQIDEPLTLTLRSNLIIHQRGSKLQRVNNTIDNPATNPPHPMWTIARCTNVLFDSINPNTGLEEGGIQGTNTQHTNWQGPGGTHGFAGYYGFRILGGYGITIEHYPINEIYSDFFTVAREQTNNTWGGHITLRHCHHLAWAGRQCFSVVSGYDILIEDFTITDVKNVSVVLDLEPDSGSGALYNGIPTWGGYGYVTMRRGSINNTQGDLALIASTGGYDAIARDVTIEDIDLIGVAGKMQFPGQLTAAHDTSFGRKSGLRVARVTSNVVDVAANQSEIQVYEWDDVTIEDCVLPMFATTAYNHWAGVGVVGVTGLTVKNNEFKGAEPQPGTHPELDIDTAPGQWNHPPRTATTVLQACGNTYGTNSPYSQTDPCS